MDFQNKKTIIEPKDGFYVIHTQIYDLSQYTKLTLDCIKDDLYNFCRNENIIIKYVISFSKNENNNEIMDDVGDINILLKSKMINGLYAELYNYLFMEYDKWDFYIGAKRQLLKELNFTIDVIPYDDYFDKIEQEKENKNIEERSKDVIQKDIRPKDNSVNKPKKRGKNARKKENRKKQTKER